jgi:dephospho-CoA kinase
MTIIALAKTLGLPVVSMEKFIHQQDSKNRRIPNICQMEGIQHLDFNQFLRALGTKL